MIYLIATIAGLIGAVAGWIVGTLLEPTLAGYRALLPEIELLRQAAEAINPAMIATAAGLLSAAFVVLRSLGTPHTLPALAWRSLAIAGVVALFAGASVRVGATMVGVHASVPAVAFEIRLPARPAPGKSEIQVELQTDRNQQIASDLEIVGEPDGALVRGSVPILFRTSDRMIVLSLPGEPVRLFKLRLGDNPARQGDFGPWQPAEPAGATRSEDAKVAIRYRVF